MKNYSSHNISPDQVKSMVDEVDQKQQQQIDRLLSVVRIHTVVAAVLIISVVGAWVQIATEKTKVIPTAVVAPMDQASAPTEAK